MKKLIIINGTMGVGKTSTCRELQQRLPNNVFLNGDWCWDMHPFVVTEETKTMVMENICFLLNQFIQCTQYETILFCWVLHEQEILDTLLSRLDITHCMVRTFSLIVDKECLLDRLNKDIAQGIRTSDVIERSIERIQNYQTLSTEKIDVSHRDAKQVAELIASKL